MSSFRSQVIKALKLPKFTFYDCASTATKSCYYSIYRTYIDWLWNESQHVERILFCKRVIAKQGLHWILSILIIKRVSLMLFDYKRATLSFYYERYISLIVLMILCTVTYHVHLYSKFSRAPVLLNKSDCVRLPMSLVIRIAAVLLCCIR